MSATNYGDEKMLAKDSSLWHNRDYMLLWSGQVISTLGTQSSTVVYPLLILALTDSPAAAGIAGALGSIPYLLFSLPAGALIDRWDRKRVMILRDIGRGLAVAKANGDNSIAILVPCHRVIGANGELTGYAGGLWRKEYLLKHESGNRT